jgi:hypothetical protein
MLLRKQLLTQQDIPGSTCLSHKTFVGIMLSKTTK